ncbi:MAG: hypothetical protein IKH57_04275, partial [Clostridia bacterium]|nr:hypothetical protein [Clostridia bacterium]
MTGVKQRQVGKDAERRYVFRRRTVLLLHQLNHELSAGDKSLQPTSLNLEIRPVFLRFRSLSGTISHPASE